MRDRPKTTRPSLLSPQPRLNTEASIAFYEIGIGFDDIDPPTFAIELNVAFDQREERIVFALANALARVEPITHLADEDIPWANLLATESLNSTTLRV